MFLLDLVNSKLTIPHLALCTQVVKEYTGKVDLLMSERKEHQQAAENQVKEQQQAEAQRNAYATLMPLALPAPNMSQDYYNQPQAQSFPYQAPPGGAPFGGATGGFPGHSGF